MTSFGSGPSGFDPVEFQIALRDNFSDATRRVEQAFDRLERAGRGVADAEARIAAANERLAASQERVRSATRLTLQERRRLRQEQAKILDGDAREVRAKRQIAQAQNRQANQAAVLARAQRDLTDAERRSLNILTEKEREERRIAQAVRNRLTEDRRRIALARATVAASQSETRELSVRAEAEARLTELIRRRQIQEQTARLAAAQGIDARTGAAAQTQAQRAQAEFQRSLENLRTREQVLQLQRTSREYRQLRRNVDNATESVRRQTSALRANGLQANRISFTFRRLFGILAAFAAARAGVQGFRNLLRDSIEFNASLEANELGIRALLTAVGDVTDGFGNTVSVAEELDRATGIARDQIARLRVDAQRTAATFDQLAETFQVAIAPGLTAGLDIDQVRQFTVQISQAAAALGVAQNQLSEEIRSILGGTIQTRTTRIAVALGITNEDIRRAREFGVLANFLQERFEAFDVAGEQALNTFNARITNLRDAFLQTIGAGGLQFFGAVSDALENIRQSLVSINSEGQIEPNPEVVDIFEDLFSAVQRAAEILFNLDGFGLDDARSAAQALGASLEVAARVVRSIIDGIRGGIVILQDVFRVVVDQVERITGESLDFNLDEAQDLAAEIIAIATAWVGITASAALLGNLITPIAVAVRGIGLALRGVQVALGAIRGIWAGILAIQTLSTGQVALLVAGIALLALGAAELLEEFTGVELRFETIVNIASEVLPAAFRFAGAVLRSSFLTPINVVRLAFTRLAENIVAVLVEPIRTLAGLVAQLDSDLGRTLANTARQLRNIEQGLSRGGDQFRQDIEDAGEELLRTGRELRETYSNAVREGLANNANNRSFREFFSDAFDGVLNEVRGRLGVEALDFDEAAEGAQSFSESLLSFGQQIVVNNQALQETQNIINDLQLQTERLNLDLLQGTGQESALTQGAQQAVQIFANARREQQDITRQLSQEQLRLERQREDQLRRQERIQRRISDAGEDERAIASELISDARALNELQRDRETIERDITALEADRETFAEEAQLVAQINSQIERKRERLEAVNDEAARLENILNRTEADFDRFLGAEDADRLRQSIRDSIEVEAQLNANQVARNRLTEQQNGLQLAVEQTLGRQLLLQNRITEFEFQRQLSIQQRTAQRQQELAALGRVANRAVQERVEAQATVDLLRLQRDQIRQRNNESIRALQQQAEGLRSAQATAAITEQINRLREQGNAELAEANANLAIAVQELDTAQRNLEGDLGDGLVEGLRIFANEGPTQFERGIRVINSIVNSFAAELSSLIVDAFDPTTDVNLRERIGRFFQQVAGLLLQELISAQIQAGLAELFSEPAEAAQETSNAFVSGTQYGTAAMQVIQGQSAPAGTFFGNAAAGILTATGAATGTQIGTTAGVQIQTAGAGAAAAISGGAAALSGAGATAITAGTSIQTGAASLQGAAVATQAAGLTLATALLPLLAIFGLTLALSSQNSGGGAYKGGKVTPRGFNRGGRASHAHARGYASGGGVHGMVRPKGLHPSDTIPAWLANNEWVIRAKSAMTYGDRIMKGINEGWFRRADLEALMDRSTGRAYRSGPGFNEGGPVSPSSARAGETRGDARRDAGDDQGASPAVLPVDQRFFDQVLASGGGNSLKAYIRDHASEIRTALDLS